MKTTVTERLGIDLPIVLAPMGGAITPKFAAAVSSAGGLGTIPLWSGDLDKMRASIRELKSLTGKPFAVNLNFAFPMAARLQVCIDEGVEVVSFFWGDPTELFDIAKNAGMTVLHSVGDAASARRAVDAGADIVVAQGWEAGGHVRGQVASMPLIPSVVDAVPGTPVIAAGGIADGRGLAAALALGAGAGWIGTRFLSAHEAPIHAHYRDRLLKASENDTAYLSNLFDGGWPDAAHRALRNTTVNDWEAAGRPAPGHRPGEGDTIATSNRLGDIQRYESFTPSEDATGDIEATSMWAGQTVGMVKRTQPAAEIVTEIMEEARAVIKSLPS